MEQSFILASASPRRKELAGYMGVPFEIIVADAEEVDQGGPEEVVRENAYRKARAVAEKHPGKIVLGSDTIVYQQGKILGKPRDEEEAKQMLSALSDSWHTVYTGVCVMKDDCVDVRCEQSDVLFVHLDEETIARYVACGEPMDKAGAYALQGKGGMFVKRIEGSYSNVIGLPMALAREMLIKAGIENL